MSKEQAILSFEKVTGKKGKFKLKNINLELKPGYLYGLIGKNGAGKTTLMKYIVDEKIRYEGRICLEGEDIRGDHARIMNKIGFVSEERPFLGDWTCAQNAEILGGLYDRFDMETFRETMDKMKLSEGKIYNRMSKGEKLKFQLAFAISHSPCLYLLDEVTAGMDSVFRLELFEKIQHLIMDETCCVLMTSHILSEIQTKTDYVGIMERGELVQFGESMDVIGRVF